MKRKILAVLLSATMLLTVAGCGNSNNSTGSTNNVSTSTSSNNTLVIGTQKFNGVFNPFLYTSAYDSQAFETVFTYVCETDENNELK